MRWCHQSLAPRHICFPSSLLLFYFLFDTVIFSQQGSFLFTTRVFLFQHDTKKCSVSRLILLLQKIFVIPGIRLLFFPTFSWLFLVSIDQIGWVTNLIYCFHSSRQHIHVQCDTPPSIHPRDTHKFIQAHAQKFLAVTTHTHTNTHTPTHTNTHTHFDLQNYVVLHQDSRPSQYVSPLNSQDFTSRPAGSKRRALAF